MDDYCFNSPASPKKQVIIVKADFVRWYANENGITVVKALKILMKESQLSLHKLYTTYVQVDHRMEYTNILKPIEFTQVTRNLSR